MNIKINKMTGEQILERLNEYFDGEKYSVDKFAYDDFDKEELNLGKVKEVEQYGGEDQGSDWYSIKHFVDHDVYIKTSGWYASHHGTDFEEGIGEIVKPVQKTITVFE